MSAALWPEADVNAFYQQHHKELLRYVRRCAARRGIPDSKIDSEGIVQDAYIAMLQHWTTISNPRAWLYVVAGRLIGRACAESRRCTSADPDRLAELTTALWTSLPATISVEDLVETRALLQAIGDLPGKQGVITYLHRVEGWTHNEIAHHLKTSAGASRIHLFRATARLRAQWSALPATNSTPQAVEYRIAIAAGIVAALATLTLTLHVLDIPTLTAILASIAAVAPTITMIRLNVNRRRTSTPLPVKAKPQAQDRLEKGDE